MAQAITQHKRMAMGHAGVSSDHSQHDAKFAKGGRVANLKTGIPTSPITDAKRANGIPGMKSGGRTKGKC